MILHFLFYENRKQTITDPVYNCVQYSIHLLLKYSLQRKCWTYSDLLEDAYPRVGRLALQIAVIINNTGILVVYLIIVGEGAGPCIPLVLLAREIN